MGKRALRAFDYRAGVRIRDSVIACDATSGTDLAFLSHAQAVARQPGSGRLPIARSSRRQLLTTELTLALLGATADRLRPHALVASYGRPFMLGSTRIELFPSGHLPGAASLLCEVNGRRVIYAGAVSPAPGAPGAAAGEVRTADALCVDGTFGSPRFSFPDRAEALAAVVRFALEAIAAGRTPVILARPLGPALDIAKALGDAGISPRGHRSVVAARTAFRAALSPDRASALAPPLLRWSGKIDEGEALLWPPEEREAPLLRTLRAPVFALASGWAADPEVRARARVETAIPLSSTADFAGLLRYVEETGASEVAVQHGTGAELVDALRQRGLDAYPVGPPRQIDLFES